MKNLTKIEQAKAQAEKAYRAMSDPKMELTMRRLTRGARTTGPLVGGPQNARQCKDDEALVRQVEEACLPCRIALSDLGFMYWEAARRRKAKALKIRREAKP